MSNDRKEKEEEEDAEEVDDDSTPLTCDRINLLTLERFMARRFLDKYILDKEEHLEVFSYMISLCSVNNSHVAMEVFQQQLFGQPFLFSVLLTFTGNGLIYNFQNNFSTDRWRYTIDSYYQPPCYYRLLAITFVVFLNFSYFLYLAPFSSDGTTSYKHPLLHS